MTADMTRRTGLLALLGGVAVGASACSSLPGPKGDWERVDEDGMLLATPSDWEKSAPGAGLWTAVWTARDDSGDRLMAAPRVEANDLYAAIDLAMNAARSVTRGYTPVGQRIAWSGSTSTLVRQDYRTTWPLDAAGTVWGIQRAERIALLDLAGPSVSDEQRTTVGSWIELDDDRPASTGSDPSASAVVGGEATDVEGVKLLVPEGWQETGGIEGSQRWTHGWALVDENDVMVQRLLVAPSMSQDTVADALNQIEADHKAGSLLGYVAKVRTPLTLENLKEAVRVDFSYGDAGTNEGCLWVIGDGTRIAAVQHVVVGEIDSEIRSAVEGSLALDSA